ncbi:NB-ARC domain-containing protein [Streptomyces buecherae]|uniref:NB-ARC domain-containing protein n=1 Tax=Streptomyces buecherae TaxID=2763006 RepID=UPI0033F8E67A
MSGEFIPFILTAILLPLVLTELGDWCPWLANRLARWTARSLGDASLSNRYAEEWSAELAEVPGKLSKLITALGYVVYLPRMRWSLSRRQRDNSQPPQVAELLPTTRPVSRRRIVGRSAQLESLYNQLVSDEQSGRQRRFYVIAGSPGVGKTVLATAVADLFMQTHRSVVHIWAPYWRDQPVYLDRYRHQIAALGRKGLLVIDEPEAETMRKLERLDLPCSILITTRRRSIAELPNNSHVTVLGLLSDREAMELLGDHLGDEAVHAEPDAALRICQLAGHLPLALEIVAAQCRHAGSTLAETVDRFQDAASRLDWSPEGQGRNPTG